MKKTISMFVLGCGLMMFTGCGEYQNVLKSTDVNYKYEYAKKAFENKKYGQAATILTDLVTIFKGTANAEESLYLLALCHYENEDYMNSGSYFKTYYQHYPKGQYTELARFYAGYGYYLDSPDVQLDQTGTYKAIEELQNFLDYFPKRHTYPHEKPFEAPHPSPSSTSSNGTRAPPSSGPMSNGSTTDSCENP